MTRPAGKSTFPGQTDGTFLSPVLYIVVFEIKIAAIIV